MTIKEAKDALAQSLSDIYEKREANNIINILLESVSGWKRHEIQLNVNEKCPELWLKTLNNQVTKLRQNMPLQYILGTTEFMGLSITVNEYVLIPRPETEELVEWILEEERDTKNKVLDIGAGSGCISIALKCERPEWEVDALEIDNKAVEVILENQKQAKLHQIFEINFLDEREWKKLSTYDLIVSNPPYIKESEVGEMNENVTLHEPGLALFVPDHDPLIFYRKILQFAQDKLNKNGHIYFEIHEDFGSEIIELCENENFSAELKKDLQGKDRMVKAGKNE